MKKMSIILWLLFQRHETQFSRKLILSLFYYILLNFDQNGFVIPCFDKLESSLNDKVVSSHHKVGIWDILIVKNIVVNYWKVKYCNPGGVTVPDLIKKGRGHFGTTLSSLTAVIDVNNNRWEVKCGLRKTWWNQHNTSMFQGYPRVESFCFHNKSSRCSVNQTRAVEEIFFFKNGKNKLQLKKDSRRKS